METIALSNFTDTDEYQLLITECDSCLTEAESTAKATIVEAWHYVGECIRKFEGVEISKLVKRVADDIQRSERAVWLGVQIYDKYPDLNSLPEGKNISLRKLQRVYLLGIDAEECKHEKVRELRICAKCEKRIK